MDIIIQLPQEQSKEGSNNLKNFIDKASIEGVESTEVNRVDHINGQMGAGDVLNSVKTVIEAATEPLVELVKCLQKYVNNYRTTITISTKNGPIIVNQGRSMTADELKKVVTEIQRNIV